MDLLFTPAKLGTCELKNRIVRSATNEHLSDEKGQVTPLWADTLIELAKNEVGLVITGHFCVDRVMAGMPLPGSARVVNTVPPLSRAHFCSRLSV